MRLVIGRSLIAVTCESKLVVVALGKCGPV